MEIRKRRYGEIPLSAKKQIIENKQNKFTPRNDSDAIFRSTNEEKATYFIEDRFSCSLYQIAETKIAQTRVKPFKFANAFTTNKIWQGGLYYTKGDKIENADNDDLKECLVVIAESSFHYKKVGHSEFYVGYVPNSSRTSVYLFKNDNLYLMEKDGHPDVMPNSYRLSEELCTIPSHIDVFNEEVKCILSAKKQSGSSLTKKLTQIKNICNK